VIEYRRILDKSENKGMDILNQESGWDELSLF
jgi:hypothetical protein